MLMFSLIIYLFFIVALKFFHIVRLFVFKEVLSEVETDRKASKIINKTLSKVEDIK